MFKKIYSSDGRIRRTEYGLSLLFACFAALLIGYILQRLDLEQFYYFGWLPSFLFVLSQGAKRCHDMGKRGWMQFIPLYFIQMIFEDGQPGFNSFGENPKGFGNFELEALTEKTDEA